MKHANFTKSSSKSASVSYVLVHKQLLRTSFSRQDGLETGVTNVKSAVGPQTAVISLDAGSQSTHPASQCSLAHLNLCSAEILGESPHVTLPSCVSMFAQP